MKQREIKELIETLPKMSDEDLLSCYNCAHILGTAGSGIQWAHFNHLAMQAYKELASRSRYPVPLGTGPIG